MKRHESTPLLYFIFSGLGFPLAFAFLYVGRRRWGLNFDAIPGWSILAVCVVIFLAVYFLVHRIPPKAALALGFAGWVTVAITLMVMSA